MINYKTLIKQENKYSGEKIIIFGCGTSLLDFDLRKINKEIYTFTFNRFLQFYNYFWENLKINFFLCHDRFTFFEPFSDFFRKKLKYLKIEESIYKTTKEKYNQVFDLSVYDILSKKQNEITKHIFSPGHSTNISLSKQENKEWFLKLNKYFNNKKFLFYKINNKEDSYNLIKTNNEASIGNPCVGSICSPILPIIYHLGFEEIYFAGIDFTDKGYFFFPHKKLSDFRKIEFDYLNKITDFFSENNRKIYSLNHKDTLISNKIKRIDFSDLT